MFNPRNRFVALHYEANAESEVPSGTAEDPEFQSSPATIFLSDRSQSLITCNDSPDLGFEASINPYRGCEHGCVYCYARPTHEYYGHSAGLDFETKIIVKEDAPEILRRELSSPRWKPKVLMMSGVTGPYQPIERKLGLTRRVLEVLAEFRNPVALLTKNYLVTRDADVLGVLARYQAARVCLSITTLKPELKRMLEPRTSSPARAACRD
jgi:DNA repair photolyase